MSGPRLGELAVIGRRLCEPLTGAGRYLECLLRHWGSMEIPFERVRVYAPDEPRLAPDIFRGPVELEIVPQVVSPLFWENFILPRRLRQADMILGVYTLPWLLAGRGVVSNLGIYESRPADFSVMARLRTTPFFRHAARSARAVIANSTSTKDDVIRHLGATPEKVKVVLLGADERLSPGPRTLPPEIQQRYGFTDKPFVLMVGKLSKRRNVPLLIEAFAQARRASGFDRSLVLIGPDYLGLDLPAEARRRGVADYVFHIDHAPMDDLLHFYRAADAFVLPTVHEGFSLTIPEAMACGTPVVAFDHAALEGGVRDACYLTERPDAASLTAALVRVVKDDALRSSLIEKGLRCAAQFRWENTARETMAILAEAARRPR